MIDQKKKKIMERFTSLRSNYEFQVYVPPVPVTQIQLPVTMIFKSKMKIEISPSSSSSSTSKRPHFEHVPVFATFLKVEYGRKSNKHKIIRMVHVLWSPHPSMKRKQPIFGHLETSSNYITQGKSTFSGNWFVRLSPHQWVNFNKLEMDNENKRTENINYSFFINPDEKDIKQIPYQGWIMDHPFAKSF